MSNINRKVQVVAECLELLNLKLLSECVKALGGEYLDGYIEMTKVAAKKRNEHFIAEKMESL